VVASGGTVSVLSGGTGKRSWNNRDNVLSTDPNCAGLSLNQNTGEISGMPTGNGTCGGIRGFLIRVSDASTPTQFVERLFSIEVGSAPRSR